MVGFLGIPQSELEAHAMRDVSWKKGSFLKTRAIVCGEIEPDFLEEKVWKAKMRTVRVSQFAWGMSTADCKAAFGEGKFPPELVWHKAPCGMGNSQSMAYMEHPLFKGVGKQVEFAEELQTLLYTTLCEKTYREEQGQEVYQKTVQNSDHCPQKLRSFDDLREITAHFRATKLGAGADDQDEEEDEEEGAARLDNLSLIMRITSASLRGRHACGIMQHACSSRQCGTRLPWHRIEGMSEWGREFSVALQWSRVFPWESHSELYKSSGGISEYPESRSLQACHSALLFSRKQFITFRWYPKLDLRLFFLRSA